MLFTPKENVIRNSDFLDEMKLSGTNENVRRKSLISFL